MFGHGRGQHIGIVFLADDPVAVLVLVEEAGGKFVVFEAAAALPVDGLGDAALVCAVADLLESGEAVGLAVVAKLDADPSAAHFMGYGCGCAGAEEGVENEICWIRT